MVVLHVPFQLAAIQLLVTVVQCLEDVLTVRVLTTEVWPVQFDHLLHRLSIGLARLAGELGLIVRVRLVPLSNELRYQFLDLVIVVQVLSNLMDKVLINKAVEGV